MPAKPTPSYAAANGYAPFNWPLFLSFRYYADDAWQAAYRAADCPYQSPTAAHPASLPRNVWHRPEDLQLQHMEIAFIEAIRARDVDGASIHLRNIQERVMEITNDN